MRNKLALTIVLAGLLAVAALGAGIAGAEQTSGLGQGRALEPAALASPDGEEGTAPQPGADVEGEAGVPPAAGEVEAPQPDGEERAGVRAGTAIDGREAGGATPNRGISAPADDGGVVAPRATAGDQPPDPANPDATIASFGPAPIGVPNFVIDSFEIPPFLLPIYQACGTQYGIPWEVLASINKIETNFGTNLNVSSAGAMGWMQFLPSSWKAFGVDANGDGRKDPYNPVDAICAAANYLKAHGGRENLYDAIFAYNHADWYVQEVLLYARAYGKLPADLVGSLTGLTEGAHFPVAADARYADDIAVREALERTTGVVSSSPTRRGIDIFAAAGAPVVAVNDGIVVKIGRSARLGRFVILRDAYGNRYTYAKLGRLVRDKRLVVMPTGREKRLPVDSQNIRPRLRALPERTGDRRRLRARKGFDVAAARGADGSIRVGSRVIAGTVLARIGAGDGTVDPHIHFAIRPAGRGAPRIDPKPILDGWKLLEATAIYRAKGKNPFVRRLGAAGVLLLSKGALERRVLAERRIELPPCDRIEIRAGQLDRRVLATLAFLAEQGYRLTVTSMLCGRHGSITTSGNVSNHSFGNAVDIAAINGIPVLGNQGPGSPTNAVVRQVMRLQGTMVPDELISLEALGGPSFAMADHADHIHIGWRPAFRNSREARFVQLLRPGQWQRLTERLGTIENPRIPAKPSKYALP